MKDDSEEKSECLFVKIHGERADSRGLRLLLLSGGEDISSKIERLVLARAESD